MSVVSAALLGAQRIRAEQVNKQIPAFAQAAIALARFVKANNYSAILISGRSSTISEKLFLTAWHKLYPGLPPPKIYNFRDDGNFLLYKGQSTNRVYSAQRFIDTNFADLNSHKKSKVCFVDDCSCAGGKYNGMKDVFAQLGFEKVDFAYLAGSPRTQFRSGDFVALRDDHSATAMLNLAKDIGSSQPEMDRNILDRITREITAFPLAA